jgi:hypothetical protein
MCACERGLRGLSYVDHTLQCTTRYGCRSLGRTTTVCARFGLGQDVDDKCVLRQVGQHGTCAPG